ncbi:uncharacterized protein LOC103150813 isoform X1 [Poecilia formosa]|uniref:uncharacterized protein LOC103150811 isoform X1 n=1 Tax=Poecilia formosa TaxID=48698 RepID=UPI0007B9AF64|nr:PREDICTED: uncharacterized protein LOC103150811 isoform X1 [Poecilia formosa]XP_016536429.1 PREDICTED: uncharacterized protein LOC103150813 isoform X1 [Poecilia formosa]
MASDHQGSFLRSIMAVSNQREQRGQSSRGERNLKPLKNEFLKSNTVKKNVLNVSQTVQIMVGVFNVGLGPERVETFPYWLGVPFMAAGVLSLLADRFPLRWLTGFSVFLNIAGSILSIVAIVLYAVHLASFTVIGMCGILDETNSKNCIFLANLAQKLLRGVDITMIVMSVLQLCVCISLAVLGNKAFYYRRKDVKDVVIQQPLVKDGHMTSPGA